MLETQPAMIKMTDLNWAVFVLSQRSAGIP
jgi:hypothetical protein